MSKFYEQRFIGYLIQNFGSFDIYRFQKTGLKPVFE